MVVLIGLGVDDDGVVDLGLGDKSPVGFHRLRLRAIRSVRVEREAAPVGGEQMDVGVDQQTPPGRAAESEGAEAAAAARNERRVIMRRRA